MKKGISLSFLFSLIIILAGCVHQADKKNSTGFGEKLSSDPGRLLNFKPNIVWIISRDVGTTVPPFGDSSISTPTLDKLARQGIRFTNVFAVSGEEPPNLCALFTGLYPTGIGADNFPIHYDHSKNENAGTYQYQVVLPPDVQMVSQVLRANGYFCSDNGFSDYQFSPPVTAWNEQGLAAHWRNRKPGQPFFSVFSIDITREQNIGTTCSPQDLRYNDPEFPDINPENYDADGFHDISRSDSGIQDSIHLIVPPYLPATQAVRNDMISMYTNIGIMDRQIGIIIDQLKNDGLMDSTIVCWFSDKGGPLPRQSGTLYDAGIHVPLIIRFPHSYSAGSYDDDLVSFVDFAPTVLSMAGIRIPDYIQGQAFLGRFRSGKIRTCIFAGSDRVGLNSDMSRIARDKQFAYLENFFPQKPYYLPGGAADNLASMQELLHLYKQDSLNRVQAEWLRTTKPEEEFYNLKNDPYEINNLSGDTVSRSEFTFLRTACANWMNSIGDVGMTPEKDIIQSFWPGGIQPRTENLDYLIRNQAVVLSCQSAGANIGYQILPLDSIPGEEWNIYKDPIKITPDIRIVAVAQRIGYIASDTLMIEFR